MGSLPNQRLSRSQIWEHCRTLCIALTEQKLKNIRLALKEKKFMRELVYAAKTLVALLGMTVVSELCALRALTILLFFILVALTFYILVDALERCKEVTTRLTQEMSDIHALAQDSDDEEN